MTVRLLVPYGKYPKNTNLTTGADEEARLLREGLADTNTGAGSAYASPTLVERSGPVSVVTTNGVDALVADGREITPVSGGGSSVAPSAFTSRALTTADNGAPLVCSGSQTATVNTGLGAGFGCSFKGTIAFAGTATVNDVRVSGAANPWCALVQTGTDAYDAVGSKA